MINVGQISIFNFRLTFVAIILLLGVFIPLLHNSSATTPAYNVDFTLDKEIYSPGDKVTITIKSPLYDKTLISLDVIEGTSDKRIFHIQKTIKDSSVRDADSDIVLYNPYRPTLPPITIDFALPNTVNVDYYYLNIVTYDMRLINYGYAGAIYTGNAMIFTNELARNIVVTDVNIDSNKEYRPGEGMPISFQISDGTGRAVLWTRPAISLIQENGNFYAGSQLSSSSGTFSTNFGIPKAAPPGTYKLIITPDSFSFGGPHSFESREYTINNIIVKGTPVTSEPMQIAQYFNYRESNNVYPDFFSDGQVTAGQDIIFSSRQDRLYDYGNELVIPPLKDVHVDLQIVNPDGQTVYQTTKMVKDDGTMEDIVFPITNELKLGVYEVYYKPSRNGIDFNYGTEMLQFYVTNLQEFDVESNLGAKYKVFFDSRDLDVSNLIYDDESKTFAFEFKNGHFFKHPHFRSSDYRAAGYASISIPKHLLADPAEIKVGDKIVDFTTLRKDYHFSSQLGSEEIINPWVESAGPYFLDYQKDHYGNADDSNALIRIGPIYDDEGKLIIKLLDPPKSPNSILTIENARFSNYSYSEPISQGVTDRPIDISAYITNPFNIQVPYTAVVEVRNSKGITEFLKVQEDTGEFSQISASWVPLHPGNYELRILLLNNLENPQLLADLATADISIIPNPDIPLPPFPDISKVIEVGKSEVFELTTYESDSERKFSWVQMTVDNVTTHTGNIEYVPYKDGFITLVVNHKILNLDNFDIPAYYQIEAIVDGDRYPTQTMGGDWGNILPNESRDSFAAIQVVDTSKEVTFNIKDPSTGQSLWMFTVQISD